MPHSVGSRLKAITGLRESDHILWVSPTSDEHSVYRGPALLQVIGHQDLREKLAQFWPKDGAIWDGVGLCGTKVILVDAKAHPAEMNMDFATTRDSTARIDAAFATTARYFGGTDSSRWKQKHYSYARRLAHLFFLASNGADVHLVFIYFTNAAPGDGPKSSADWTPAIAAVHQHLGLPRLYEHERVHELFVDVGELG
jgi:hypothetical protein